MKCLAILSVLAICYATSVTAYYCYNCYHLSDAEGNLIDGDASCAEGKTPTNASHEYCDAGFLSQNAIMGPFMRNRSSLQDPSTTPWADDGMSCFIIVFDGEQRGEDLRKLVFRSCVFREWVPADGCATKTLSEWRMDEADPWGQAIYMIGSEMYDFADASQATACTCSTGELCNGGGEECKGDNCGGAASLTARVCVSLASLVLYSIFM